MFEPISWSSGNAGARGLRGSNLGPVKSDTVLPTARHRCNISSKETLLPWRNDVEMAPQLVTRFGVLQ